MIQAEGISKRFGAITAVEDLGFQVETGEIVALLGPNGAGKTTCMRMLSGFLNPDRGHVRIGGFDPTENPLAVRRSLGYLPEHAPIYREASVLSYLRFIASARGLGRKSHAVVDDICERLTLNPVAHQIVSTLSKGSMRRVALAAALMHRPPVLLLDEPTDGLDPIQKQQVRRLIQEFGKNSAILMSTHQIDDVLAMCPRTLIMGGGRKLLDKSTEELLQQSKYHNAVSLVAPESIAARAALEGLSGISGFEQNAADGRLYVFVQGSKPQNQIIAERLSQKSVPYLDLRIEVGRLDEVFAKTVAEARS
jgi:ABC-2 type transport system ATP-binding protein